MSRVSTVLIAIALTCGLVAVGSTGASAADATVSIKKIADKTVAYNKAATVRPHVSPRGHVKVLSKRLTVKSGKRTVARNATKARLRAGKYAVTTTVRYRTWTRVGSTKTYGPTKVKTLKQKLTIKQRSRPAAKPSGSKAAKPSGWNCPSSAPIKGNASSRIYHVPSGSFYGRTKPEQCFANEADAIKAGYRKSKV
ncbi:sunset domain-containing protein [Aeromicrobium wangtongii]|uniref:Uncharacterized protein n=1 Tax=Aeromicrobium wangtongii TaxID=2969247 RepID=A0ABY5M6I9_9ACTN|nr:hypothetical protein [Aeromicrobium wangtongii]MCD9198281.1 hypothetical protein [Aeromicrobium wangtongii]UUP12313.1 hypothetical protein NQV15_10645 [Aeromicrobium wangtongii]